MWIKDTHYNLFKIERTVEKLFSVAIKNLYGLQNDKNKNKYYI